MSTSHYNSRSECVHLSPSPLSLTPSEENSKLLQKTFFSRNHFDSSPDTTFHPMSDSIFSSVKYFLLLLAEMPHFMNHSYMSSRLKMSQRKQIMWCHHSSDARNLKQKGGTLCLVEASFNSLNFLKTPAHLASLCCKLSGQPLQFQCLLVTPAISAYGKKA